MIDFAGGIGVLNIGHRHPKVVEAVKAQLDKLMHTCQTVMPYEGYVKLAQKLSERAIPHNGPCTVSEGLPPPTLFTSFNVTKKHTLLSSTPLLSALRMCWLIINHCML